MKFYIMYVYMVYIFPVYILLHNKKYQIHYTHYHSHFLPIEQHAMDLLDSSVGCFLSLKGHKPIAFGLAHLILGHLT